MDREQQAIRSQRNGPQRQGGALVKATLLKNLMGSWIGAAAGASFYGAIVAAVNWDTGAENALRSAAAHATVSAALTLFGTSWMRMVFNKTVHSPMRLVTTFLAGMALTYLLLIGVHLLLNTPRLLLSLIPGFIPNVLFCATYSSLLSRTSDPTTPAQGSTTEQPVALQGCMP